VKKKKRKREKKKSNEGILFFIPFLFFMF